MSPAFSIILTLGQTTLFYYLKALNLGDSSHRLPIQISQDIDNIGGAPTRRSFAKMIIDLICDHFLTL